jgi:hypothetical protein
MFPNVFCVIIYFVFGFFPKFPNTNKLYTLCFAQRPPLVNYISGSKEKTTLGVFWDYGKMRSLGHVGKFYFRSLLSSGCFWSLNERKHHQKEK